MAMGVWTWPLMGVVIIIMAISVYSTLKVMNFERRRQCVNDSPVSEQVKEHPALLNPIFWVYIVALGFMLLMIFVYAVSSSY